MAIVDRSVDRQQLDRSDAEADEVIDHCRRDEPGKGAAMRRLDIGVLDRDAAHVQFEDDRLFPWGLGAAILTPGEGGLDHPAFWNIARIVAPIERQILARAAEPITEHRVAPAEPPLKRLGVRIDQQLVRIEAMPVRRDRTARKHDTRKAGSGEHRADRRARPRRCIPEARCAPPRGAPERSNRHSSTFSACAEKIAKLTPSPSQVAPSGYGRPGHTFRRRGHQRRSSA